MEKLKVGVIRDGKSPEREVYLNDGRSVYGNHDNEKYDGIPIVVDYERGGKSL